MHILSDEKSNQADMETWFQQLNDPDFPLRKQVGILSLMDPQFTSCDFAEKALVLTFAVQEWELNPEGGLHGGIIVTGFDMSFGLLCHYFAKQHMICTVNLSTTFLKPVQPDDTIHYQVHIVSHGRTLISMIGEAWLERDHILAATATTTFMVLDQMFTLPI